jgi:hypothetical protein
MEVYQNECTSSPFCIVHITRSQYHINANDHMVARYQRNADLITRQRFSKYTYIMWSPMVTWKSAVMACYQELLPSFLHCGRARPQLLLVGTPELAEISNPGLANMAKSQSIVSYSLPANESGSCYVSLVT